jgi:hypothetical protein
MNPSRGVSHKPVTDDDLPLYPVLFQVAIQAHKSTNRASIFADEIAVEIDRPIRAVRMTLAKLVKRGYLSHEGKRGEADLYRVLQPGEESPNTTPIEEEA